jgi:hypothetical protein
LLKVQGFQLTPDPWILYVYQIQEWQSPGDYEKPCSRLPEIYPQSQNVSLRPHRVQQAVGRTKVSAQELYEATEESRCEDPLMGMMSRPQHTHRLLKTRAVGVAGS